MSFVGMCMDIDRNLHLFSRLRYPWLTNIPTNWASLVRFFEDCTPVIYCKVMYWKPPLMGTF